MANVRYLLQKYKLNNRTYEWQKSRYLIVSAFLVKNLVQTMFFEKKTLFAMIVV